MPTFALGRVVEHDPASRLHPVTATATPTGDRVWRRHSAIMSQGDLGCCTGAAMAGWLGTEPHAGSAADAKRFDIEYAKKLYSIATTLDPFPGNWPPTDTGSSGNAVAKAARQLGDISSYRWAFTTAALLTALQAAPVIVGVPWHEAMFAPDRNGRIWPHGEIAGGHEVLIRGVVGRDLIVSNSWGRGWGINGEALLPLDVWNVLRKQQADVTVPRV